MPKAYLVCDIDVTDPDAYERYKALAPAATAAFGGTYLARGGATTVLEGDWDPQRLVIVEFPDVESAKAFYDSPAYLEARQARANAAIAHFVVVEGA